MEKDLNELRDKAYLCAIAHGWHEEELSNDHWLCLVVSELKEAVAADRKGNHADTEAFSKYYDRVDFKENFERQIKDTVEDELADACIRLFDLAGLRNVNLSGVVFPISNSIEHVEARRKLTFTEWCFDVTSTIARFKRNHYPLGYLFIAILQEICCMAEIIGFDLLWHIEQKMKYNELREYKHGDKKY